MCLVRIHEDSLTCGGNSPCTCKVCAPHVLESLPEEVAGLLAEPAGDHLRAVEHLLDVANGVGVLYDPDGERLHVEVHGLEHLVKLLFGFVLLRHRLLGGGKCRVGAPVVRRKDAIERITDGAVRLGEAGLDLAALALEVPEADGDGVAEDLDVLLAEHLELLGALLEVAAHLRDVVEVGELADGLVEAERAAGDLREEVVVSAAGLVAARGRAADGGGAGVIAGAAKLLGDHVGEVVDGLLEPVDGGLEAGEVGPGLAEHLEAHDVGAGGGHEAQGAQEALLALAGGRVRVEADERELDAGLAHVAQPDERVAQRVGPVGQRDLLAELGPQGLHGGEDLVVVPRHAADEVDDDHPLLRLGPLDPLVDGRLVFVGAAVAAAPAGGGPIPERLREAGVVARVEGAAEGADRHDELGQVIRLNRTALELLVKERLEVGVLAAVQVLVHAEADLLQRLVDALGDAGGGAQAADRGGEAVGELRRARPQAKALDEGVLLRLVAQRDLELPRGRRELDVEDVLEQLLLPHPLGLGARVQLVEGLEVASECRVGVLRRLLPDLPVDRLHDSGEHPNRAEGVLHAGMDGEELGVHALGEAVPPLAHGAADLDGAERSVDELVVGIRRAGGELGVEEVGDDAADLLLGEGSVGERLALLRVGDLCHELAHDLVEVALGVDADAGVLEGAGQAPDHVLLRLGRERGLVLAEAARGVGVLVAAEVVVAVAAADDPPLGRQIRPRLHKGVRDHPGRGGRAPGRRGHALGRRRCGIGVPATGRGRLVSSHGARYQ